MFNSLITYSLYSLSHVTNIHLSILLVNIILIVSRTMILLMRVFVIGYFLMMNYSSGPFTRQHWGIGHFYILYSNPKPVGSESTTLSMRYPGGTSAVVFFSWSYSAKHH